MNRFHVIALFVALAPAQAHAQEQNQGVADDAIELAKKKAAEERKDGWKLGANIGGTLSFLHSSKVVGQVDGVSLTAGGVVRANADLTAGDHEWLNSLSAELLESKTPSIDPFVKASDLLDLRSLYLYHIPAIPWAGPYARLRMTTAMLPGDAVFAADTPVRFVPLEGDAVVRNQPAQTALGLTSFFEPFTISESVGGFIEPVKLEIITANAKVGVGGNHVLVRDGFVVTDDPTTPELDVTQLQTIHSAGVEAEVDLKGVLIKDRVSWNALAGIYYPLVTSVATDLDAVEIIHAELGAGLSVKLAEGFSLDYVVRARRAPFVLNDWQLQNSLLLTIGFTL